MHRELAAPLVVGDEPQSIAMSIGIAAGSGQASDDRLRQTDTAMYAAKAAGRGRHETFVPGITGVRHTGAL